MQPATASPRDDLSADDVADLIHGPHLHVTAGLELLDDTDVVIGDITDDLSGGEIEGGNYRTIHRTCQLRLSRRLQWGWQRVRPYMTLAAGHATTTTVGGGVLLESGGRLLTESGDQLLLDIPDVTAAVVSARFNLGVYLLSTPTEQLDDPETFDVEGYDKLEVLNTPHGAAHTVEAGVGYLTAAQELIEAAGETAIVVDPAQAAAVLSSTRVWPLDEATTTLHIVNDLLAAVNYRAVWVDWDGNYRLEPYVSPSDRPAEWTYDADDPAVTIVGEARQRERDFFAVPNRWVGVRNDPTDDVPVDGSGRYETVNQSDGDTSIAARGRVITRTLFLDAASQAPLVAQVEAAKERDMAVNAYRQFTTGPNPLHWHFDVARIVDAAGGAPVNVTWLSWRLPLDGGDMTHETREV